MTVVKGTGRPTLYRLADRTRVPSVTTITSRFKDSGGLMHWAWTIGLDGGDYRERRDEAASAGSIAHGWIEGWIHGEDTFAELPEDCDTETADQAAKAFNAFRDWADQVKLEIPETEVSLISERYRYGGTLDANALVAGKPTLLDWKTSNGTYPEYVVQLAAYRQLLRERDTNEQWRKTSAPAGAQLLRVGKEHADFHAHFYPESVLDIGWRWFERAREMYDLDKDLKKVCS